DLSALEKQVLVERHLISREHAAKSAGSAVVMNRRQTLSIMINEEDHLRMQSMRSGLQLKQAFKLLDKIDTALENDLEFAYDERGERRRNYRPAYESDRDDHRKRTRRAPCLDSKKIKHAFGPNRSRLWSVDPRARDELERGAQFVIDHQAWRRPRRISGRQTVADRRIVHRHSTGAPPENLAAKA